MNTRHDNDLEYCDELLAAAIDFIEDFHQNSSSGASSPSSGAFDDEPGNDAAWQRSLVAAETAQGHASGVNAETLALVDELSAEDHAELTSILAFDSAIAQAALIVDDQQQQVQLVTTTTTTTVTKKKTTWGPNKARNKRREELVLLRRQVEGLELQLAEIKRKKRESEAEEASGITTTEMFGAQRPGDDSQTPADAPMPRVWEEIAKNQLAMRTNSEREHIRLKFVLESQLKIAKGLKKYLRRVTTSSDAIARCFPGSNLHHLHMTTPSNDVSDAAIIDGLLAGLDQSYAEIDAVFATNGLANSESPHLDARMHSSGGSNAMRSLVLEVFATKVLPFDFETTKTTVWDHFVFGKERIQSRVYYNATPRVFLQPTCSYIKSFHVELYAKSTSANLAVKQVVRRYDEPDRVVIVLRSYIDQLKLSHEPLSGVRFLERGYIAVKKPTTISGTFTLLQACHIVTPMFHGQWAASSESHPKLGIITDFVLTATSANLRATHQMIEDELLQHAMQSSTENQQTVCVGVQQVNAHKEVCR